MRVSKFIKAHRDILIEYIYDDENNISDSYKILRNLRENSYGYMAASGSTTYNTQTNQLFQIDPVTNNYGLVNTTNYTFLQLKDYPSGFPLRHDTIKIHVPINYTFGEYLGCYIRVFGFDYNNQFTYDLSNFYFDNTDVDQSYLLNYNAPPLLFQEKLWGKNITINVPSLYAVSNQRVNNAPKNNTLNANLTNGLGMSLNSPIFIDFHFITQKKTVNSVTSFYLTSKTQISLPQTPDFENLGVKIEHSPNGDYFEIFGVFNGDINQFDNFINNSVQLGSRYFVNYTITLYEQNIRGKTFTITVTDNFNEKVEYRPIIKYSTTTAIIDVEMMLIDAVDNSSILRRASYGMLQDEVAKYSLNLMKINIANANKPKIYNQRPFDGTGLSNAGGRGIVLEPIKVNYAVLVDKFNVIAKSDSVSNQSITFYGIGQLRLLIQPFDNVIVVKVARDVTSEQTSSGSAIQVSGRTQLVPEYLDMSGMGEIKFVVKNTQLSFEAPLYFASNQVDLVNGITVFRIPASKINDLRRIYDSGINVFYITGTTDTGTTVIYSGLYFIYDSRDNVQTLNAQSPTGQTAQERLVITESPRPKGTAVVTRKVVPTRTNASGQTASVSPNTTSVQSTVTVNQNTGNPNERNNNQPSTNPTTGQTTNSNTTASQNNITYSLTTDSSLVINGYTWNSGQLKTALNLDVAPRNLSFKTDRIGGSSVVRLYSNNQLLGDLTTIKSQLEKKFLVNEDQKNVYNQTQNNFKPDAQ